MSYFKTWFPVKIPKSHRAYIREMATNDLGIPYRMFLRKSNNKRKKSYWGNKGTWMVKGGVFYFQTAEKADHYAALVTYEILKRPNYV